MSLMEECFKNVTEEYLKQKVDVYIDYNNELDEWTYSVAVINSNGFWLDSFDTEEKAIEYCKKHELKIVK
jgi:hypothetical protein